MICAEHPDFKCKEFTSVLDQMTLKGKKALVTGAAGGIGRSTAQAFAELGADIALMDIPNKEEALNKLCKEIKDKYGVNAVCVLGDVSRQESVLEFVNQAVKELGTIDVLHNNAGIILPGDNANASKEDWDKMIGVDLTGIFLVGRTVANVMIEHKHGGAIINTASMSGHIVNRSQDHTYGFSYPTAKAGVMHLTKAMAANYIKYGIRVNSISPGVVLSGIHDPVPVEVMKPAVAEIPLGRFGKLDEIAGIVAFLATDLAGFMVGSDVLADGGQTIN
jgi:NAD(P)-dependent dehydrogenase (short-subunit alcohol dehydrogenase family)